jgi:hypothetical protein
MSHPGGTVGDWSQAAFAMPETIQSVVRCQDNGPLLAAAATLWIHPGDVVLDATYGRGRFWTCVRPENLIAHDLALDGVDFCHLPEADASVDVVVFDPPYIENPGAMSTIPDFTDRYGLTTVSRDPAELLKLVGAGIVEGHRVLKPKGRLMVKCMDYVNRGRFQLGRHNVVATALALGMDQVDEFVHYSGTGPQPPHNRQVHSRRAHTFLCIFQKPRVPRKAAVNAAVPPELIDGDA